MGAAKTQSDLDRFNGKYIVDASGCWLWTDRRDRDGYAGYFRVGSRTDGSRAEVRPHRWIYEQLIGPIALGLVIDHLCRTRHCVNPFHLEPVPPEVNTKRGSRAAATHCKHGHPLSGENLYIRKHAGKVSRSCVVCRQRWSHEHGLRTKWAAQKAYRERAKSVGATN